MRNDIVIKREGFHALKEKLDPVEIERFVVILSREKFDYTKWRQNLFENMTIEELATEADKYSKGLGNAWGGIVMISDMEIKINGMNALVNSPSQFHRK